MGDEWKALTIDGTGCRENAGNIAPFLYTAATSSSPPGFLSENDFSKAVAMDIRRMNRSAHLREY